MDIQAFLDDLRDRLSEDHVRDVLNVLRDWLKQNPAYRETYLKDVRMLRSNFSRTTKNLGQGILGADEAQRHIARVVQGLMGLLDEMEDDDWSDLTVPPEGPGPGSTPDGGTGRIGPVHQYLCDRSPQTRNFLRMMGKTPPPAVQFFCIHGEHTQSHYGLFQRFYFKYLAQGEDSSARVIRVNLNPDRKIALQDYKLEWLFNLFEQFNWEAELINLPEEEQFPAFLRKLGAIHVKLMAVEIKIRNTRWKENTPDLIRWLTTTFFNPERATAWPVRFYVFFSVVYDRPLRAGQGPAIPSPIDREGLCACIEDLPVAMLDELEPVAYDDIEKWVDKYLGLNAAQTMDLLQAYFPERRPYDMVEIEKRLEQIIDAYNNQELS